MELDLPLISTAQHKMVKHFLAHFLLFCVAPLITKVICGMSKLVSSFPNVAMWWSYKIFVDEINLKEWGNIFIL